MELKLLRLPHGDGLPLPTYATAGAAGMDLYSAEDYKLFHGHTKVFATGFAAEVPEGYELQIRSRSGLAAKQGVFVTNGIGTIDCDYRGELFVILSHLGRTAHEVKRGDRIAQMVLVPVTQAQVVEASGLSETNRGAAGLGSTGR